MSLSDEDELMGDPRPASFGEFDVATFDDEDMEDQVIISIFNHLSRKFKECSFKKTKSRLRNDFKSEQIQL